jgi:hypothetical protein
MADNSPKIVPLNVRVPESLRFKLERERNLVADERPGMNVTLSDVVRAAIERGLAVTDD